MAYKYGFQGSSEHTARAVVTNAPISTKTATMLAQFLRGKSVARARADLAGILDKRVAVPFTRFTEGAGHKPGSVGPGKYPEKASKVALRLLESAVSNAEDIGLGEELYVKAIIANKGARSARFGRHRGRQRKATHMEIILAEIDKEDKTNGN